MRLQQWASNGWLRPHQTSPSQIADLLGSTRNNDADYLDTCRAKRNTVEYDAAGMVSPSEATELRTFTHELRTDVIAWLKANHPTLITKL